MCSLVRALLSDLEALCLFGGETQDERKEKRKREHGREERMLTYI